MVNWLVIGIGDITRRRVLPAIIEEPWSRLYGILTRSPDKAIPYSGAKVFTELDQALGDPRIDAVYVATPVMLHATQAIAALRAGKHVLCEKPVATNYPEAASMAAAADEAQRILAVAYYRRTYPKVLRARALLNENAVGSPTFAFACYNGWLESVDRGWLKDPASAGGGPFYDVASHRIDALNFLFGQPERAVGLLSNAIHQLPVEDSGTAVIGYPGGVHAVVDARWNSHITRDEFRIIGVNGAIDLSPLNGPDLCMTLADGQVHQESHPTHPNVHLPLIENFVSAVLDGTPVACPIREAIQTDWVTERIFRP